MVANSRELPRRGADVRSPDVERIQKTEAGARLVAKVLRQVLAEQRFTDVGRLREALEARCQDLGMAATRPIIERAFDLVGSNAQLLAGLQKAPPVTHAATAVADVPKKEATAILKQFGISVSGGRLANAPTSSDAPKNFPRLR